MKEERLEWAMKKMAEILPCWWKFHGTKHCHEQCPFTYICEKLELLFDEEER